MNKKIAEKSSKIFEDRKNGLKISIGNRIKKKDKKKFIEYCALLIFEIFRLSNIISKSSEPKEYVWQVLIEDINGHLNCYISFSYYDPCWHDCHSDFLKKHYPKILKVIKIINGSEPPIKNTISKLWDFLYGIEHYSIKLINKNILLISMDLPKNN